MTAPSSTAGLATLRAGATYYSRRPITTATLTLQAIDAAHLERWHDRLADATEGLARTAAECATRRISSAAGLASIRGGVR